jgi:hypothetical protein
MRAIRDLFSISHLLQTITGLMAALLSWFSRSRWSVPSNVGRRQSAFSRR